MLADKLYVSAKDCQLNGDEEKAYVLYMRYYHMLKSIWKDSTYKKKKVCTYLFMHVNVCVCVCVCMYVCVESWDNKMNNFKVFNNVCMYVCIYVLYISIFVFKVQ